MYNNTFSKHNCTVHFLLLLFLNAHSLYKSGISLNVTQHFYDKSIVQSLSFVT